MRSGKTRIDRTRNVAESSGTGTGELTPNRRGCCAASRSDFPVDNSERQSTHVPGSSAPGDTATAPFCFSPSTTPLDLGMVYLKSPEFLMGSEAGEGYPGDGEAPQRTVKCSPYRISACTVSNAQFARFVTETGYVTDAERYGWSFVFHLFLPLEQRTGLRSPAGLPWWLQVKGACWSLPEGPGSHNHDRMDHPVTHVTWRDANAFCHWSGSRLPTEAEWEYAARGGLENKRYGWGDSLQPDGRHQCNIWQGEFPNTNTADDGYTGTAPVDSFEANGHGLYNVCGNVWEWCADWFSPNYHRVTRRDNPIYLIPSGARSIRGGSFLCHRSWCNRYRVAARSSIAPDTSTSHCGFRVVALSH